MSKIKEELKSLYTEYHKDNEWFYVNEEPSDGDLLDFLNDGNLKKDDKHSGSRWWNNMERIVEIEGRYFRYHWAETTGDMSIWDSGWEFDWNTLVEVEPYQETIIVTKYRTK